MIRVQRSAFSVQRKLELEAEDLKSGNAQRPTPNAQRFILRPLLFALCFVVFFLNHGVVGAQVNNSKKTVSLEKRLSDLEQEVATLKAMGDFNHLHIVPENLSLCDKKISLAKDEMRERFERSTTNFWKTEA